MNQKLQYEQTITSKLESLPVPGMANAIWSRIEQQLDLDLPTGNNPGNNNPNLPGAGIIPGGITGIFLMVSLAIFFKEKNQKNHHSIPFTKPKVMVQGNEKKGSSPNKSKDDLPLIKNNKANRAVLYPVIIDSVMTTIQAGEIPIDTQLTITPPAGAKPEQERTDTVPAIKKKRGVQGISDDDYEIAPKHDSLTKAE